MRVYEFTSPMTNTVSSFSVGTTALSKTTYITIIVVTGIVLTGLLAVVIVVPVVSAVNAANSIVRTTSTTATTATTTTATTTTVTTATTTTATTTTTKTTTSTTSTTTTTTSTTSTTTTRTTTTSTTSTTTTTTTTTSTTSTKTTSTSTTSTTSTTTSALPVRWNATGLTMAGSSTGSSGVTASLMNIAYSLALDSSNALYVTDYSNNRIQKWASGASSATTVAGQSSGASGASSTALNTPVGIVLDSSNNMYFTDRSNHRVMYWANNTSSGTVIAGITGSPGSANNQLNSPSGLFRIATTGTLYIADTGNHRIVSYLSGASSGTVVAGGNGQGTGSTQLNYPYDFTWDSNTNSFIIVNYGAHTVVRWVSGATSWTLLAGVTGTSGSTSTMLSSPLSVVLDSYSNMYVSDTANHRIQYFPAGQSTGTTIAGTTGSAGTSATQLNTPYWAIIDSQFNLYVADTSNNRIQKFSRY